VGHAKGEGKASKKDKILSKINGEVIEETCEEERNGPSVECSAAVRCYSCVPYRSLPSTNSLISLSRPTTQSSTRRSRIILEGRGAIWVGKEGRTRGEGKKVNQRGV
jgi:hypothetical protein